MSIPLNRDDFKEFCLRKLGKPVIEINIADEQAEDRIDEALSFYWDYHFDGAEKTYYKHTVTQDDIDNRYFTVPDNIIGAIKIFPIGNAITSGGIFNIRYQIAINDLYTLTNVSLVPYYMVMEHLALMQEMLVGQQPIRFSRHKNQVHVDMDWGETAVGDILIIEAYQIVDPAVYIDVWKDRWLQEYASCLMEETWGKNLSKFTYMTLPGGIQFNGDAILERAIEKRLRLEEEMNYKYSLPPDMMVG